MKLILVHLIFNNWRILQKWESWKHREKKPNFAFSSIELIICTRLFLLSLIIMSINTLRKKYYIKRYKFQFELMFFIIHYNIVFTTTKL